ncbi:MAG: SusC/RagA family TonB-linked outer membrane protein [Bacteroidaceae bacterium]
MKYNNRLLRMALACAAAVLPSLLFAQKAGDIISGVVEDNDGPMMMVNVTERDAADRIVAHAITDIEGNFSFKLVNPKDRIQISYVGYETVDIPINKLYFEIKMKDQNDLPVIDITADRVLETSGLPIPLREVSSTVATINMEEFEGLSMTTVDEALQGRVPGLDIVFNSGDLGSRSTMHLRGVSTMTGDSNPLIVVDGNIWEVDSNLKNNFDYQNESQNTEKVSELLNINPEDIATISILRDAAATAIWGARGANGVMEIKTKRGSRGKTRVNYSYRLNATWQPEGYKLLNGDQYTMFMKESFFNPALSDAAADIIELNYDDKFSEYEMYNDNTDWVAAVKKVGLQHGHNVSVSGGGDKANFRVSAGFDDQTGSVIGQKMNRFTTRVAFDYFISQRITVTTNFSLTYSKNKQNSAAIGTAMKMMPNLAIYYEDAQGNPTGEYYHMLATASEELPQNNNPLAEADEKKQYSTSLNVNPEFSLRYNLLGIENDETKLTYEGRVTFGVTNSGSDSYTPSSLSKSGWSDSNANAVSANSSKSSSIGTTHSLTFIPHLNNPNHSFMMMVRYQLNTSNNKGQNGSVSGLPSGPFESVGLPGKIGNMSTSAGRSRSMNVTFTAHYSYKSKYSLDLTTRSDGNTRFGDAKRWGTFPALSGRWNIIDEKFMERIRQSNYLTMLAMRVSWGLQGNAPGGDGMFYSKYSSGDSYLGESTMKPDNIRLSSMQWEETTSWNLGFDLGLFRDKMNISVEVYDRLTEKMLNSGYSIPSSSGFNSLAVVNEGSMRNQGWEFSVSANRLYATKLLGKDFNVGGNINFADNTNQILEMNPTMLEKMNSDFDYKNGSYLSYVALKNAFGSIYGFKYKGVYQYSDYSEVEIPGVSGPNAPVVKDADGNVILNQKGKTKPMMYDYGTGRTNYEFVGGDAIYEDINNDGNINELDIVYLGSSLPKLNGGFGLRMSWGRLTWNNQFNFRWGNRIVNGSRMNAECMYNTDNTSAAINWRWRVEGDVTTMPRALHNYGYNYLGSDRYVEDGSFLRWNYTSLNYSLDPKITKKLHVSNISFNFNLNNVVTWTKYSGLDPESAGSGGRGSVAKDNAQTPRSKQITCGVSVQF